MKAALTRALLLAQLMIAGMAAGPAWADSDDLYQGQTIVTGQRSETRLPGLARCLTQVLVKLSGDPRLADDPQVAELAARANDFVLKLRYHDRMAGMPLHDEQGTRDRPYDLTVDFDEAKINAALASLGRQPWTAERPRVLVLLAITHDDSRFILTSNGSHGIDQRDALNGIAGAMALPIMLPSEGALQGALATKPITVEQITAPDLTALNAQARALGAGVALVGTMSWSDQALGWTVTWHLAPTGGAGFDWQVKGVSFDDGFRAGVAGTLQALSGHGEGGRVLKGL